MSHLKPTNDFIFKKIFGQTKNADILKDLLEAILPEIKIDKVEINKDVSLERKIMTEKLGILDVVATLNNSTKINIEMQVKNYYNTIERSLFYITGMYHENLEKGTDYTEIPKSISIWITDYNIFEEGPIHEKARIKREYENKILTNKIELHYIQLPKFQEKSKRITNKLEQWLTFIKNENVEEIKMIENKYIKKAEKELEYLTGDEETRRLAELREKAIRDEMAAMSKAKKEGITETKQEVAKKMLAKKIDIKTIIEITGLTKEEIQKL